MTSSTNSNKNSLLSDLRLRELGKLNRIKFIRKTSGNHGMVRRLKLSHCLEGHSGCVNSTYFSPGGDFLISGSDDRDVIMWNWQEGSICLRYSSGHFNNVFQAKIMPNTNDKTIVTCAADGQVRYGTIQDGGGMSTCMLGRHRGRTHKIAIEPGSPYNFFSCGEDGIVRFFDLRLDRQDSKLLTCTSLDGPSRYFGSVGLTSIAINPSFPYQFGVAGYDQFARIYDMRKISDTRLSDSKHLVDTFAASHFVARRNEVMQSRLQPFITGIAFSPQQELAISYSDEHIYLFDKASGLGSDPFASTYDKIFSPSAPSIPFSYPSPPTVFKGHRNAMTIKGVSFFGSDANYVMSGSECGNIFIWDKADGSLTRKFRGDAQIVNSLESHPHGCFLASSGIDDDIKLWMPTNDSEEVKDDDLSIEPLDGGPLRHRFEPAFLINRNFMLRGASLDEDEISPLWIDLFGDALARNINGARNRARMQNLAHDDSADELVDNNIEDEDEDEEEEDVDDENEANNGHRNRDRARDRWYVEDEEVEEEEGERGESGDVFFDYEDGDDEFDEVDEDDEYGVQTSDNWDDDGIEDNVGFVPDVEDEDRVDRARWRVRLQSNQSRDESTPTGGGRDRRLNQNVSNQSQSQNQNESNRSGPNQCCIS